MTNDEIENVIDNIKSLCYKKKLIDEDGDVLDFLEIVFEDQSNNDVTVNLSQFANMKTYVEPKSEREIKLETKIKVLELELLEASKSIISTHVGRINKKPVTLSYELEVLMSKQWKEEKDKSLMNGTKKPKLKDIAEAFNVSPPNAARILSRHEVYEIKKKHRKVTDA